jgi:hypothetical protein
MAAERITVAGLAATPVKGLRIGVHSSLRLERGHIAGDRLFYLVDDRGRLVNGKRAAGLQTLTADYDERVRVLTIGFPAGERVEAPVELGAKLQTRFYSDEREARLVNGPFAQAISEHLGFAVRLVAPADGGAAPDRGAAGAVSMISGASLALLARVAGEGMVDARRFRMSMELAGPAAHEEDEWVGMHLAVGEARIAIEGHVGRCIVTTRNPESDEVDLPTLDLLRSYRAAAATSEPLAFGVYGAVLEPGSVRVGDEVVLQR